MPGPLFRKYFAILICLVYLLAGTGGAHALIWCYQADGRIHVEYNPAGSCASPCDVQAAPGSWDRHQAGALESFPVEECLDVPALQAHAKNIHSFDSGVNFPAEPAKFQFESGLRSLVAIREQLLLSPQPPPPSPVLAALRTVVLLN